MPTFMFFKNGQKVDEIKGADPHGLASKVQQHCTASASESSSEIKQTGRVKGMSDLNDKIELRQLEMLNGSDDSDIRSLLGNKKAGITSDTDEQCKFSFAPCGRYTVLMDGNSDALCPLSGIRTAPLDPAPGGQGCA